MILILYLLLVFLLNRCIVQRKKLVMIVAVVASSKFQTADSIIRNATIFLSIGGGHFHSFAFVLCDSFFSLLLLLVCFQKQIQIVWIDFTIVQEASCWWERMNVKKIIVFVFICRVYLLLKLIIFAFQLAVCVWMFCCMNFCCINKLITHWFMLCLNFSFAETVLAQKKTVVPKRKRKQLVLWKFTKNIVNPCC